MILGKKADIEGHTVRKFLSALIKNLPGRFATTFSHHVATTGAAAAF